MIDRNAAAFEICDFIMRRLEERVTRAEQTGDNHARSFAKTSREIVKQMRLDLVERPWAHYEVENFLLRTAKQYRAHPEYQSWWG